MKTRSPLVIGNWKMNPLSLTEAVDLAGTIARKLKGEDAVVVITPPFPFLAGVRAKVKDKVFLGAQDLFDQPVGAFTGEVSAAQLRALGVSYAIIGHSERRARGESDDDVQRKVLAALKNKITPVVCIGERERDEQGAYFGFIESQLRSLATALTSQQMKQVVIAYEPIWAIGTGATATPEDVKEMQLFIVSVLSKVYDRATAQKVRLIYGGSVKAKNARELHERGEMEGFLVGGASLDAAEFMAIIEATKK